MTSWTLIDREWPSPEGGTETQRISAELTPTGELKITGCDSGPAVEAFHGDWDYEYGLTLPPADFAQAIALLAGFVLKGQRLDFAELVAMFQAHGLKVEDWTWA